MSSSIPLSDSPTTQGLGVAKYDLYREIMCWRGHWSSGGRPGRRYVKLNTQAQSILQVIEPLWLYRKDYVSHKFKKEVRRLGIRNARFHDLRRTFGLNFIKQGMSIYKVSKLLGHASVRTTEQHYAPLLTVDIEDFTL